MTVTKADKLMHQIGYICEDTELNWGGRDIIRIYKPNSNDKLQIKISITIVDDTYKFIYNCDGYIRLESNSDKLQSKVEFRKQYKQFKKYVLRCINETL